MAGLRLLDYTRNRLMNSNSSASRGDNCPFIYLKPPMLAVDGRD